MTLIAGRSDSTQARQRLSALLDQLHIEIIRSYRRRQTSSQRTMQEILLSQYNISQLLRQCPPEQIDWLQETPMGSGCLGLWAPSGGTNRRTVSIAGWYHRESGGAHAGGMMYPAPQFPPLDLLPSSARAERHHHLPGDERPDRGPRLGDAGGLRPADFQRSVAGRQHHQHDRDLRRLPGPGARARGAA